MANDIDFVRKLFTDANVLLDKDDVWTVQKTPVVRHKALERLAAAIGVKFSEARVLRSERDEAVILVTGWLGDKTEWSIGEARIVPMADTGRQNQWGKSIYEPVDGAIGNYQVTPKQGAYPYAMAEKRGKDRVVLKLAGLAGAYSEEEADDFRAPRAEEPRLIADPPLAARVAEVVASSKRDAPKPETKTQENWAHYEKANMSFLPFIKEEGKLKEWWDGELVRIKSAPADLTTRMIGAVKKRLAEIREAKAKETA